MPEKILEPKRRVDLICKLCRSYTDYINKEAHNYQELFDAAILRVMNEFVENNTPESIDIFQSDWIQLTVEQDPKPGVKWVAAGNLYTFMVMCGDFVPPWEWTGQTTHMGKLGYYSAEGKRFILKRRSHSTKIKAAIEIIGATKPEKPHSLQGGENIQYSNTTTLNMLKNRYSVGFDPASGVESTVLIHKGNTSGMHFEVVRKHVTR